MISFISSLEIIIVVTPDPNIFLWIGASVTDAAAVNPNGIKTLLDNSYFSHFLLKATQFLVRVLKVYLKILLIVLFYVTEFLIILYQRRNYLQKLYETCVLVNNNLCGSLFSSLESPTTFDERFTLTLVPFFSVDFSLLSSELDNVTFKVLHCVIIVLE